jgi:hypothetical protein
VFARLSVCMCVCVCVCVCVYVYVCDAYVATRGSGMLLMIKKHLRICVCAAH